MDRREFLLRARIDPDAIDLWVDAGWLAPRGASGEWTFSEIDLARTRLIQDRERFAADLRALRLERDGYPTWEGSRST